MKVIMFSSDANILNADSSVAKRMISYGKDYDSLDIILLNRVNARLNFQRGLSLSERVNVFPTNSFAMIFAPMRAFFIGARLVFKKQFEVDGTLITAQDPFEIGLAGYLLHLFTKIPLELQLHTDVMSPYFAAHTTKNRLRTYLAKFLIPRADKVRVVSNKIKEGLVSKLKINADKIEVRPIQVSLNVTSGVQGVNMRDKYPGFAKYILMVSRLTSEKNYPFAFDLMKELPTDVALIIVGDGPLKGFLQNEVVKRGLEERVKFEGWHDNTFSYYESADVLFHAALYEGYGVVFKEAEQAGLPIVSSDVGIASDTSNARVYPVNDGEVALRELKQVLGI